MLAAIAVACGDNTKPQEDAATGSLSATKSHLAFDAVGGVQELEIREDNYGGGFTLDASGCSGVASISMANPTGPLAVVNVSSVAAGQCVVTASDSNGQVVGCSVTVTTTTATFDSGYVPATVRSLEIVIDQDATTIVNLPSASIVVAAPPGDDLFEVRLFDEADGLGNVLGNARLSETVSGGVANVIAFAPSAVIGSLSISLGDDAPNAGVPAAVRVTVNAFDADGNKIENAGFTEPIALSVDEMIPSGTLSLSPSEIQGSGDSVTLAYNGGTLTRASIVASAGPGARAVAVFHPTPTFYEVARLMEGAQPEAIAAGPDGNMWVTEQHAIARITPAGDVTEFPLPPELSDPAGIIAASDGRLWFTSSFKSALGAMTTDGSATVYPLPTSTIGQGLVDRGDGTIWYTGVLAYVVGSLEIAGSASTVTYIPSTNTAPDGIAVGPDNQLYFTESGDRASKIGRINAIGDPISEVLFGANVNVGEIVRGPDNNMWFTEVNASKIGRLDPVTFTVTGEFPTLTADAFPTWITVGSDGALWFTEYAVSRIGRITTDGTVQEFVSPVPDLLPNALVTAPDGSLWFCEITRGAIGRFVY